MKNRKITGNTKTTSHRVLIKRGDELSRERQAEEREDLLARFKAKIQERP